MTTPSVRQFSVAAATSNGRVVLDGSKVKGESATARYFKKVTNYKTRKSFRKSLQRKYGERLAKMAVSKYGLNSNKWETLSGQKITDVVAFCEENKDDSRNSKPASFLKDKSTQDYSNLRQAGQSALLFLDTSKRGKRGGRRPDGREMVSTNNPFGRATIEKNKYRMRLHRVRNGGRGPKTAFDMSRDAMRYGAGNCGEKARVVEMALRSNPRLKGKHITTVHSVDYDHAFCVVTDKPIKGEIKSLKDLGHDAMIVDGWTEDCYFPNQRSKLGVKRGNGVPNPRQAHVRRNVRSHGLAPVSTPLDRKSCDYNELPQVTRDFFRKYPLRQPVSVERFVNGDGSTKYFKVNSKDAEVFVSPDSSINEADKKKLAAKAGDDSEVTQFNKVKMTFVTEREKWDISYLNGVCKAKDDSGIETPFTLGLEDGSDAIERHEKMRAKQSFSQSATMNDLPDVTQKFFAKHPLEGPVEVQRFVKDDGKTDFFKLKGKHCEVHVEPDLPIRPRHKRAVHDSVRRMGLPAGKKWSMDARRVKLDFSTHYNKWSFEQIGGTIYREGDKDGAGPREEHPLYVGLDDRDPGVTTHRVGLKGAAQMRAEDDTLDL